MNLKATINILCATDNGYAPYCGIMLTSLLENNKDSRLMVYVFVSEDFSQVNRRKFKRFEEKYDCAVVLMVIDDRIIDGFPVHPTNHPITIPTYYRLLAPQLLPHSIQRVIYLDCDIIIQGSLKPLWETDMEGAVIAGVKDCWSNFQESDFVRLGYQSSSGYFNAGAVMIDLAAWRQRTIDNLISMFIKEHADSLSFMDQDALNGVLFEQKTFIPERYNFQTVFLLSNCWNLYSEDYHDILRNEKRNAVVIHFCGLFKPWDFRYLNGPFQAEWEKYRKLSDWKCCRTRSPLIKFLKFWIKRNVFPSQWKYSRDRVWVT